ncbi:SAM-dependent methyltransferase [Nonomuraea sp. NPDC050790]|uniref:SAM-dependent methyltransferase n=1 Tax=Nonomuraea sp. NPDC050790 TaxID=3364371 RepID=UPI00378F3307
MSTAASGPPPTIPGVYNDLLEGRDNTAAERDLADQLLKLLPRLRKAALANARFIRRAVDVVAGHGVAQFIDLGCGLPTPDAASVLEVVSRHHEDTKVVYVDIDPKVAVHCRALLRSPGRSLMLEDDAREVDVVLGHAAQLLDLSKPVGLIAAALLHFWQDDAQPGEVLQRYARALAPGSYLVLTHACGDKLRPADLAAAVAAYSRTQSPIYPRSAEAIKGLLAGMDVLDPGLVEASQWRPDDLPEEVGDAQFLAAVARLDGEGR